MALALYQSGFAVKWELDDFCKNSELLVTFVGVVDRFPVTEVKMDNVSKYLEDLKSPSKNKRFDACYYLRLMDEIPNSAMLALQDATNDPDHLVAKEARKAIQLHSLPKEMRVNTSSKDVDLEELFSKVFNSSTRNFLKTYGLLILVLLGFSLAIFGGGGFIFLLAFLGGPILFLILVIGGIGVMVSAFRGNKAMKSDKDELLNQQLNSDISPSDRNTQKNNRN